MDEPSGQVSALVPLPIDFPADVMDGPEHVNEGQKQMPQIDLENEDANVKVSLQRLQDVDPERRRGAAIHLGQSGEAKYLPILENVLKAEKDERVVASLLLAVGAIGGDDAAAILDGFEVNGETSSVALGKAKSRLRAKTSSARWKDGLSLQNVYLEVPVGLERPATLLLIKSGWPNISTDSAGLLKVQKAVAVSLITPAPRWCYGARILLGEQSNSDETAQELLIDAVSKTAPWAHWLERDSEEAPFPYRLKIEGRVLDKRAFARLIAYCRAKLEPAGAVDSPSSYAAEIVLSLTKEAGRVYYRPSFYTDDRFSYRTRDVSAAMNAVVAATLARLAPPGLNGAIIDPVCGSGVPLIERSMYDPQGRPLIGLDINAAAVDASRTNIAAAGMAADALVVQTDARDVAAWQACGFVIANLPYGLRVKLPTGDLDLLYLGILRRVEEFLTPEGRCVLATAYKLGLERALKAATKLRTLARYRVQTGGLHVQIVVLARR